MTAHDSMNLAAGVLQFCVAGYALRLNRIFGSDRVGWSLFTAFSLLALLHLAQSMALFKPGADSVTAIEATYALISLLMLTGMVHIETLFKERRRLEQEEVRLRALLEEEVQKKTAYLMRAIEQLQTECDECRRMEAEVEAHVKLLDIACSKINLEPETRPRVRF